MSEFRPVRICDVCGAVDNHPRHVFVAGADQFPVNEAYVQSVLTDESIDRADLVRLVDEIRDTTIQQRHMDCCAEAGCPDGSCVKILGTVASGTTGDKLVKHLTSGAVDKVLEQGK